MTPTVEEERDVVERTVYLLVAMFTVVPAVVFGTIALRDGAVTLGLSLMGLGIASATVAIGYVKGWIS